MADDSPNCRGDEIDCRSQLAGDLAIFADQKHRQQAGSYSLRRDSAARGRREISYKESESAGTPTQNQGKKKAAPAKWATLKSRNCDVACERQQQGRWRLPQLDADSMIAVTP
jgi:hypothetical protein